VILTSQKPDRWLAPQLPVKGVSGVEGLHGPAKYNGLAESGADLDPHIICKNLGNCPTAHAERHFVRDEGVAGSNPHSDQLSSQEKLSRRTIWGTKPIGVRFGTKATRSAGEVGRMAAP
jgi:hypothetical protein